MPTRDQALPLNATRALTPHRRRRPARPRLRCEPARDVDRLDGVTRAELGPLLYAIFCDSYGDLAFETVTEEIVFRRGGSLYLIRDASDSIVGFGTLSIDGVKVGWRTYSVLQGGVYMRRGVRGGGAVFVRRACLALLRARLRHPLRPLYAVFEFLTPYSYRLAERAFARVYPSRRRPTPPRVAALLNAAIDRRGLARVGDDPFVVSYPDPASHQRELSTPSTSRDADPDVAFYLERNPRFAEGHILCGLVPLNLSGLIHAITRCARLITHRRRS